MVEVSKIKSTRAGEFTWAVTDSEGKVTEYETWSSGRGVIEWEERPCLCLEQDCKVEPVWRLKQIASTSDFSIAEVSASTRRRRVLAFHGV